MVWVPRLKPRPKADPTNEKSFTPLLALRAKILMEIEDEHFLH